MTNELLAMISLLQQQNQKNKEVINKAIEYIEEHKLDYKNEGKLIATEFDSLSSPYYLLSILKEVE